MMRLSCSTALLVGVIVGTWAGCAASARGQVVYSTYGPGDTYSSGSISATFSGYGWNAARFVPASSGEFNQVETTLSRFSPTTVIATVSIVPEVVFSGPGGTGALPGVIGVWSATAVDAPLNAAAIYKFTGPRATLTAGQAYWLVLEASDATNWHFSQPGVLGSTAFRNGSPWITQQLTMVPAFRVSYASAPSIGSCCNRRAGGCAVIERGLCETMGLQYGAAGSTCATSGPCHGCLADFNLSGDLNSQDIFDFLNSWFAGCP